MHNSFLFLLPRSLRSECGEANIMHNEVLKKSMKYGDFSKNIAIFADGMEVRQD